jgi:hypothetical protein
MTSEHITGAETAEDLLQPLTISHAADHRDAYSLDKAVETATSSRRFFVTARGYMGLGPAEMQPGDQVFALAGGSVPFVLRDAGMRQIPGLTNRQFDMKASRYAEAPVSRGRGSTSAGPADVEVWSDCSSTPLVAERVGDPNDGGANRVPDCPSTDRSRSASTGHLAQRGFAPNGSYANEVSKFKVGISIQPQKTQSEASAPLLSRCYTLIGDCFVHGIMDGEAMNQMSGDGQEDIGWDLVYLI